MANRQSPHQNQDFKKPNKPKSPTSWRFICLLCSAILDTLQTKKQSAIANHQSPKQTKTQKPEYPNSPNHPMICRSPRKWRFICLRCNAMSDTLRTQSYVMLSQQTKTQFLGPSSILRIAIAVVEMY